MVPRVATCVLVADSWLPLTASVEAAVRAPGAMFVRVCAAPGTAPVPPAATAVSWLATPVRWIGPTVPLLTVVASPPTAVLVAKSWEPLTASVEAAVSWPAATFWICRGVRAVPTDTAPVGAAPAKT